MRRKTGRRSDICSVSLLLLHHPPDDLELTLPVLQIHYTWNLGMQDKDVSVCNPPPACWIQYRGPAEYLLKTPFGEERYFYRVKDVVEVIRGLAAAVVMLQ